MGLVGGSSTFLISGKPGLGRETAQDREPERRPEGDELRALRDRAILAVLLYHGLRRDEVARLTVGSLHEHRGVPHLRVRGKGSKTRPVPVHPAVLSALNDSSYLGTTSTGRLRSFSQLRPAGLADRSQAMASTSW